MVEQDEGFFSQPMNNKTKIKQGKSSQNMRNFVVMAESVPLEDRQTGRTSSQCRFCKMILLVRHSADPTNKSSMKVSTNKQLSCLIKEKTT